MAGRDRLPGPALASRGRPGGNDQVLDRDSAREARSGGQLEGSSHTASAQVLSVPSAVMVICASPSKVHSPSRFHWAPPTRWLTRKVLTPPAWRMAIGTLADRLGYLVHHA